MAGSPGASQPEARDLTPPPRPPAQARRLTATGSLVVTVEGADDLPTVGTQRGPSPYVRVLFRGAARRTRALREEARPRWGEALAFPGVNDPEEDEVEFVVVDQGDGMSERGYHRQYQ